MITIGENRLHPDEALLLAAVRRWFISRTAENFRHLVTATRDWLRAERAREAQGAAR